MSETISVLIADDHVMVRTGLRLLLESNRDIRVVGECGTHAEVLDTLAKRQQPIDVVTLDWTMPGGPATRLVEEIVRCNSGTRVVVLTMHEDPSYARLALAAGASAYIVKSAADTELLTAVRTVARGGMHTSIAPNPQPVASTSPGHPAIDTLSEREREVLLLVARGHTNQQVAERLFLSVKTVESYRARLMAKLGLKDRAELTRFVMELGLLGTGRS